MLEQILKFDSVNGQVHNFRLSYSFNLSSISNVVTKLLNIIAGYTLFLHRLTHPGNFVEPLRFYKQNCKVKNIILTRFVIAFHAVKTTAIIEEVSGLRRTHDALVLFEVYSTSAL